MAQQHARTGGNVRIGTVSFITLVSILLIAVLAVLCVATANASFTTAQRQANSVSDTYAIDSVGQAFVAAVDTQLAKAQEAGKGVDEAVSSVSENIVDVETSAFTLSGEDDCTIDAQVSGRTVTFTISGSAGRTLEGSLTVNSDFNYTIDAWKMSTAQSSSEQTLWSGTSANN